MTVTTHRPVARQPMRVRLPEPSTPSALVLAADCGCDALAADVDDEVDVDIEAAPAPDDLPEVAYWEGVLGVEGEATGDGRYIENGALTWETPFPLRYVSSDVGAHDGAVVVGKALAAERRDDGLIWGSGIVDLGSEAGREAYRVLDQELMTGVSMDLDDVNFEVRVAAELVEAAEDGSVVMLAQEPDENGRVTVATLNADDELRVTTQGRVRAATMVAIPAFSRAHIGLTTAPPAITASYNPTQVRAPRGTSIGGQWILTPGGVRGALSTGSSTGSKRTGGGSTGGTSTANGPTLGQGYVKDFTSSPGSATEHLVHNPDGSVSFTPERAALHRSMIDERMGGITPREGKQTFNLLGGGPAAGKSGITKEMFPEKFENAALINADDYKMGEHGTGLVDNTTVPEGTPPAAWVHEESSYLAKESLKEGYANGVSQTLDGTGDNSAASTRAKIAEARENGYAVDGYYVTCPTDAAIARSQERAKKPPYREVPESVLRSTHDKVSQVFPLVVNDFDYAVLMDTENRPNVMIGEKQPGGSFVIYRPDLWDKFLAKATEIDPNSETEPIPDFEVRDVRTASAAPPPPAPTSSSAPLTRMQRALALRNAAQIRLRSRSLT